MMKIKRLLLGIVVVSTMMTLYHIGMIIPSSARDHLLDGRNIYQDVVEHVSRLDSPNHHHDHSTTHAATHSSLLVSTTTNNKITPSRIHSYNHTQQTRSFTTLENKNTTSTKVQKKKKKKKKTKEETMILNVKTKIGTTNDSRHIQNTTTSNTTMTNKKMTKEKTKVTKNNNKKEENIVVVDHLLNVPFYIYPGWGVLSHPHSILRRNGQDFDISTLDPEGIPIHSINEMRTKHADDYLLAQAAYHHPMRTNDPSKAKLFYIPTPFNLLMEDSFTNHNKLCLLGKGFKRCNKAVIQRVDEELGNSYWFQRYNGRDHILVASHWMWTTIWQWHVGTWGLQNLHYCNAIDFEGQLITKTNRTDRITFPSYYVGKRCTNEEDREKEEGESKEDNHEDGKLESSSSLVEEKTQDFAMITTLTRRDINVTFQDRVNICHWVQNKSNYTMDACGLGPQCPQLANAKFGFHAVGDTPGSNRPMDTLLSHTIPIFTRQEQYDVLPKWIDWDQISYFANVSNSKTFFNDLQHIMNQPKQRIQQTQYNVIQNQDLFDYETIVPFDTYMYMFQVKLFPDTKRTNIKSKYSALLLP